MSSSLFAFIGMPGPMELLIILGIFLLLFGSRLPSVMRNLGASAREFKKGIQQPVEDLEEAQDSLKKAKPKAKAKDDAEEQKEQAEA
jgi:sec-independent protein translocase protein TatA